MNTAPTRILFRTEYDLNKNFKYKQILQETKGFTEQVKRFLGINTKGRAGDELIPTPPPTPPHQH